MGLSQKWWVVALIVVLIPLSLVASIITMRPSSASSGCAHNTLFLFRHAFSGGLVLPQIDVRLAFKLGEFRTDITPQLPFMC
jgi:hypothetical protein